jgi:hypothetical protein
MRKNYAQKKLFEAVFSLVDDGSISERLGYAHGHLAILRPEDFPDDLLNRYKNLMNVLGPGVRHFPHKHSVVKIRQPQSGKAAQEIFELFCKLSGSADDTSNTPSG